MTHIDNVGNEGLLSYGITTNPSPLQVSPASGSPSMSSLVFVVSNNTTRAIYCQKIEFEIQLGDDPQQLTGDASGILVSCNPSNTWRISQIGTTGLFVATPIKPEDEEITVEGLSFQIYNIPVNKAMGTTTIHAYETSSTQSGSGFEQRDNSFDLVKFPYGFYVGNFAASKPMVRNGEQVTLSWNGSDIATYTIIYDDKVVNVTNVRSWTSPPLTHATTFQLKASVQQEGETVDTYLSVTVMVAEPDIAANSLQVLKTSKLEGDVAAGATLTVAGAAVLGSTLGVAGTATLADATANSLRVANAATLGSLAVGGGARVTGGATLDGLTVNGNAVINGNAAMASANVAGAVSMMKGGTLLYRGTRKDSVWLRPQTDGFLVAQVYWPNDITKMSIAMVNIYAAGTWFSQTGGSVGTFGRAWSSAMQTNANVACVPVRQGESCAYGVVQGKDNQQDSDAAIYWFPLGAGNASQSIVEMDERPEGVEDPPRIPTDFAQAEAGRIEQANEFVSQLADTLGTKVPDVQRAELAMRLARI
ncbi:hypothetical protein [Alteriqipengyuania lutimaris]|uniref:Tail fiber domain-containing protein n=1 Tax=Alteriqipengyuania lutimaris TaxID=1538146 RepID=A0A395LKD0_9SPHN|nr:hypothetical protein [Alteriqipengyuania lutimaris]MBB3033551.1 hypothetical protein [Alteriqipengyuania lutimaris]RDS77443.1 hypothetical protein DL238_07370 [Alteriqipengyuania lutimaris]